MSQVNQVSNSFNGSLEDFFNVKPVVQEQQQVITEFRPNPKKGQNGVFKAIVRFLPNPSDPGNKSIISKYSIYLQNPVTQQARTIDCPSTVGQPDMLQTTFFALRASADPVLQENAKKFSRKQQFASLVQILSCESEPSLTNKILVWRYGIKVHEKLMNEMNPPIGEPKNPFNLITGRPFLVQVKEVAGFPNYDACQFFDLDLKQSGMVVINNDANGVPQTYRVTSEVIATPQGKEMVFNYLKDNAPDTTKYEYHDWTAEEQQFVNECIKIYSNAQLTVQAMSAAQNPGAAQIQQQPQYAQAAKQPTVSMPTANTQPFTGPATMPQMPVQEAAMPTMGLDSNGVAQTNPAGYTAPNLGSDVDALINGKTESKPAAGNPAMGLDLADILNGQIL